MRLPWTLAERPSARSRLATSSCARTEGCVAIDEAQFFKNSPRLVAIYLDEYHITAGASADRAREALTAFVDRELGPRDLIAVMKPLDSLYSIRLTDDRQDARRIIAGLEGRKGDYTPRTAYERSYMAGSDARIETERTQIAISALNALAEQMGSVNNLRKTLLVVTEGFEAPARRRGQEYLATIDSAIRSANRANVAIYPIDPRPASAGDGTSNEALRSLADETDGRMATNAPGIAETGRRDPRRRGRRGRLLHAHVPQHAQGGWEIPSGGGASEAREGAGARAERVLGAVSQRSSGRGAAGESQWTAGDSPRAAPPHQPADSAVVRVVARQRRQDTRDVRVGTVRPRCRETGAAPTAARLELTVLGAGDAVVFQGPVLPTGPGMVEAPGSEPSRAVFDAAPGPLRLRMKIQDATRQEVDSDVREIAVRDLRGRVAIGTPEFLRARNAREFRTLDNDPEAVPVSSRQFSRTERLLVRFPAYAPDGQQPSVSARLLNRMGQPMRTLEVRPAADGEHEIDIMLAGLATGDYQLELAATSPAGKTTEVLGFRVTSSGSSLVL